MAGQMRAFGRTRPHNDRKGRSHRVFNRKLVAVLAVLSLMLVMAACGDDAKRPPLQQ